MAVEDIEENLVKVIRHFSELTINEKKISEILAKTFLSYFGWDVVMQSLVDFDVLVSVTWKPKDIRQQQEHSCEPVNRRAGQPRDTVPDITPQQTFFRNMQTSGLHLRT